MTKKIFFALVFLGLYQQNTTAQAGAIIANDIENYVNYNVEQVNATKLAEQNLQEAQQAFELANSASIEAEKALEEAAKAKEEARISEEAYAEQVRIAEEERRKAAEAEERKKKAEEERKKVEDSRTPPPSIGGQAVDEANSVVFKGFNMHPEWDEAVLVADWTGSMYSYVGQVLAWHQMNLDKGILKEMVLFNDGDDNTRLTSRKIIGNTGGIYYTNPSDMDDVLATVEKAVDNGDGGDGPENDLEAILKAQQKFKDADYFILIADNSAVRDMALLPRIKKPVHILMCDGGWINDYVRIAYETGGSITLLNDHLDFSDKSTIDEGNIMLSGMRYDMR